MAPAKLRFWQKLHSSKNVIYNDAKYSNTRNLSVKLLKEGQDFLEIKEIKQEDGSLVIKVSLKKLNSDNPVVNETKVANV